jgi:hypothetical protein
LSQRDLLMRAVAALEDVGVPYMLTGSFAASVQGEPRQTHDIDFVVALEEATLDRVLAAFPDPAFYVDVDAARRAVRERRMFNVIDTRSGDKIDFWMLTATPFDRTRFSRRASIAFLGRDIVTSTPEDTILQKLRWSLEGGGSEVQLRDVRGILRLQRGTLDRPYLDRWAGELGVEDLLARVESEAERP